MFSERARLNRKKGWSKVTPLQETAWFRDLCADGDIEPNPGPSSSISCAFLNCNGLSRAWEALDEMCSFDRFCLAETQADQWHHQQLVSHLQSKGYRVAGVPGKHLSNRAKNTVHGGLLVASKAHIPA